MSTPPLFAALLAAGPDALRCLFTEAQPTRAVLLANLSAGWPDADTGTLGAALDTLLAAGHLLPSVSTRGRYRLASEVLDTAESRHETGIKSDFSESLKEPESRLIAVSEPAAPAPPTGPKPEIPALRRLSYFRGPISNPTPHADITLPELHRVVTHPPRYLRERADAARAEFAAHGKSDRFNALKRGLDYFTASGIFTFRNDQSLVKPTGLIALDFDNMNGRVAEARAALLADEWLAPALQMLFVSPSGDGLKALVLHDPRVSRAKNYERLAGYFARRYGWGPTLDRKTADVSRACFVAHDPDAWLAPASTAGTLSNPQQISTF